MSQFNKVLPHRCEGLGTVTLATLASGTRRWADSWRSLASQHSPISEPRSLSQNPRWMAPNKRDITRTPMHTHASAHTCALAQTQNSKQSRCNERTRLWSPKDCSVDSSVCKDPESGTLLGTPLPIAQFHLDSLCVRYPHLLTHTAATPLCFPLCLLHVSVGLGGNKKSQTMEWGQDKGVSDRKPFARP